MTGTAFHEGVEIEKDGVTYYVDINVEWSESRETRSTPGSTDFEISIVHANRYDEDEDAVVIVPKSEWSSLEDWAYAAIYRMSWEDIKSGS